MRLLSIISAAAIAVVALAATPDAFAQRGRNNQSTTAVAINYQRVLAESALGRDIQAKLGQVRQQIGTEAQALQPEGQAIEQEGQRLQTALRNRSPEQIRNDPAAQAFAQRQQQFQARASALQGDFECTQVLTLREFDRLVSPVVRSVMEARGAGIVLDSASAQLVLPEFDITTAVIQQLDQNQATRTANVTRQPVAQCTQQAPAQAPPAQ
ncbi:MAG: OmpH family outer membrane protein [Hyphomonadaceae bacterium JAD_PAG50586_4]|nr:MAG: OmpH family outer membrane protein [Hyphomonadaceae bacterium JAD_PAG50586_4]